MIKARLLGNRCSTKHRPSDYRANRKQHVIPLMVASKVLHAMISFKKDLSACITIIMQETTCSTQQSRHEQSFLEALHTVLNSRDTSTIKKYMGEGKDGHPSIHCPTIWNLPTWLYAVTCHQASLDLKDNLFTIHPYHLMVPLPWPFILLLNAICGFST